MLYATIQPIETPGDAMFWKLLSVKAVAVDAMERKWPRPGALGRIGLPISILLDLVRGLCPFYFSIPSFIYGFLAAWCPRTDSVIPVLRDWSKRSNVQFASVEIFDVGVFFVEIQLMDPFSGEDLMVERKSREDPGSCPGGSSDPSVLSPGT